MEDEFAEADLPELELGPGITRIKAVEDVDAILENKPLLVYENQLFALARTPVYRSCTVKGCKADVLLTSENVASAVYMHWVRICFNECVLLVLCIDIPYYNV